MTVRRFSTQLHQFRRPISGGGAGLGFVSYFGAPAGRPWVRFVFWRARNLRVFGERYDIRPIFVPTGATGGMRSSDVMGNVGGLPFQRAVNGRGGLPKLSLGDKRSGSKRGLRNLRNRSKDVRELESVMVQRRLVGNALGPGRPRLSTRTTNGITASARTTTPCPAVATRAISGLSQPDR